MDDKTASPAGPGMSAPPATIADAAALTPAAVKLLADWGLRLKDTVLRADPDTLAALDAAHVPYRPATADESAIGIFGG